MSCRSNTIRFPKFVDSLPSIVLNRHFDHNSNNDYEFGTTEKCGATLCLHGYGRGNTVQPGNTIYPGCCTHGLDVKHSVVFILCSAKCTTRVVLCPPDWSIYHEDYSQCEGIVMALPTSLCSKMAAAILFRIVMARCRLWCLCVPEQCHLHVL